jgi:cupin fold WbuC family metalloprotein
MNSDRVQVFGRELFDSLIEKALASPRLRTNYNFHGSMDENPHRFLNVMARGTYVTPHRHLDPPKAESFVALSGEVAFFIFDDAGKVIERRDLGRDAIGIDVAPGVWHSLAVLSDVAVCYEVKPGPYTQANDKDFAPWAPREGDPRAAEYLAGLLATRR